jgi:uncharacterized protein DUF4058
MPQEGRPECDYSVMVSRAEKRRAADFWPIHLRDRLPVIPISLRFPDAAASVDLQQASPSLRRPRLRAFHLQPRARTEPVGERQSLGTTVCSHLIHIGHIAGTFKNGENKLLVAGPSKYSLVHTFILKLGHQVFRDFAASSSSRGRTCLHAEL